MYKITLYDFDLSPICDGVTFWFVEDLSEFEKKWLPLQVEMDGVERVERYYRSKLGEVVTDYYLNDSPELNIVQQAEAEMLAELDYQYKDKKVTLYNAYYWDAEYEFDTLDIRLRVLRYGDKCYLVGQYKGCGCRQISMFGWNRWYETEIKYEQMEFWGNPVATYKKRGINWDDIGKPDWHKDFLTNDKDFYKHEEVETFVWLPIKEVDASYEIKELSDDELAILMRDIIGE